MSKQEKMQSMSKALMGKYTLRVSFPADDAVADEDVPELMAEMSKALRTFAGCWEKS